MARKSYTYIDLAADEARGYRQLRPRDGYSDSLARRRLVVEFQSYNYIDRREHYTSTVCSAFSVVADKCPFRGLVISVLCPDMHRARASTPSLLAPACTEFAKRATSCSFVTFLALNTRICAVPLPKQRYKYLDIRADELRGTFHSHAESEQRLLYYGQFGRSGFTSLEPSAPQVTHHRQVAPCLSCMRMQHPSQVASMS